MTMRLTIAQSLAYMKMEGYPMGQSTFSRMKATLKKNELKRLHQIAALGFQSQHVKRLDTLENVEKLMWENYYLEKIAYRKVWILNQIKELQPYISTYYDTTKAVLESRSGAGRKPDTSLPEQGAPTEDSDLQVD